MEPEWLVLAREIQAIAQTGLTFAENGYDRERYERLRQIAALIMAGLSRGVPEMIEELFAEQSGYATPKLDVRGAIFDGDRILLVQEKADNGRWTLPGGWADVNLSPSECVIKEVREEAGLIVKPVKLAAVYDRRLHPHPPLPFHIYKLFFLCQIVGGAPEPGTETTDVAFFSCEALPELSVSRVLEAQIRRMLDHAAQPDLPTDFD